MLSELFIENVAVIEKAEIRFMPGLNVLTGETGAGKSILIDSVNAILGNRTSKEIVRSGSEKAVIWATFDKLNDDTKQAIVDLGYDQDDTLVLYREISLDGGSKCRINQRPATAAAVRELCSNLINIHGQHDNQELLNPERHIFILDRYAELTGEVTEYSDNYKKTLAVKRKIESLDIDDAQKERQMDLLRYQIDEITKADLFLGEDDDLLAQRNAIRNSEKILEALNLATSAFNGSDESSGILSSTYDAMNALNGIAEYGEDYAALYSVTNEQYYALSDLEERLSHALDSFDFDPSQLQEIEERLDLIYRLKRKYGDSIEEIFGYLEKASADLELIETSEHQREELEKEYSRLSVELRKMANTLSEKRKAVALPFENTIKEELAYLNMQGAQFVVNFSPVEPCLTGIDSIEFYLSTNAGEPPKPLSKIASGGELSRIMLAIKNTMADKDSIGTLIFDEIDTGISGNSAFKIGKKLKQSAVSRQTICVTHSAQVASFADNHLLIAKSVRDGRTYTTVTPLDYDGRKQELARIISGDHITETSLSNADEMLMNAKMNSMEE